MIAQRIQERLAALGISQAELARRAGMAQSTVNGLINGKARTSARLHVIARVLGVSTAWLAGETDDSSIGDGAEGRELAARHLDAALVPLVDFTRFCDGKVSILDYVPIARVLLKQYGNANGLTICAGHYTGDNMSPTIGKGELVLVDQVESDVRQQDSLWWLCYGELGTIRRVRRLHDGHFELFSDSPAVPPVIAREGEFEVLGRVVCVTKSL